MKTREEAQKAFEDMQVKERLEQVYSQVPKGSCAGCTACCSEAVNTFYSEYLNLSAHLQARGELAVYSQKAVAYYLTELVKPAACPMLMADGLCAVYEARPLPCRVYGHLEESDYLHNQEQVINSNRAAAQAIARDYGFELPRAVVERKLAFCEQFKSEAPMGAEERDDLVDLLFTLESRFLMTGWLEEDELNYSLVQWFAYETLGQEQAGQLRLKVTEEFIKSGQSQTLLQTMDNIAQRA